MADTEKGIPLKEGMWTSEVKDKRPRLVGSQCTACGEIFFPRKEKSWCLRCHKRTLKDTLIGREARIVSCSVVMQQPGGGFYKGPVPYAYGEVDLPEGVRIVTLFSCDDFDELERGKAVELMIDKLHEDEHGNDIITFKFRPKRP